MPKTVRYQPRYDYDRYPMMVLSTGSRGIEFFDEWRLTYASDEGVSESDAEMLLILHWLQFAEGVGLSPGHVKAPQALFRVAKE